MNPMLMTLMLLIGLALIALLQVGFVFVLLAMLPTLIAFYTDTDPKRSHAQVIGCANLAAMLPSLTPMIKEGLKMKHDLAIASLTDLRGWMLIYAGAGCGWMLIFLCRYIAQFFITLSCEYRIVALKRQQRRLTEEWGDDVARAEE